MKAELKTETLPAPGPVSNNTQKTQCTNPATGELLGYVQLNTVDDLHRTIAKAKVCGRDWAKVSVRERVRLLRKVRDYMVDHACDLAEVISADNGKTRVDALATEVLPAIMACSYYCNHAKAFVKPKRLHTGNILLANKRSTLYRVPFGVVGIISPWNYPFAIPFSEVVMALLAGNGVILKTATQTQMIGQKLADCFHQAGLPEGLFTHLNLPGRIAGDAILEGGIDKLFFTGSVGVGKVLMAKAAATLTPVSLELGGNDAMLVCPGADLDRAAAGAVWAGMQNCGQSCGGVERIYVHTEVYDRFMALLKERIEALRVGADKDHHVDLGAMTTQGQAEIVKAHIEDAMAKGAVIHAQSPVPRVTPECAPHFLPATVLANVTHDMRVMKEESFGPVVGVMRVNSMDEAVQLANDSDLGLTASVWTKKNSEGVRIGRQIVAGAVTINDHLMSHGLAETPWGGFKESGIGRTHGSLGFDEMTQPQVVVKDIMPLVKKNMWWYPHGPNVYQGLNGVIKALYGKGLSSRLSGVLELAKLFPRSFRKGG